MKVDLMDGFMFAKLGKGAKGLNIKSGDKTISATSSNAEFQISDGNVTVTKGQLALNIDGKQIVVNKNQYLNLLEGRVKNYDILLISPKNQGKVFFKESSSIFFEWKTKRKSNSFKLFVAKDSKFKEILQTKDVSKTNAYMMNLPEGPYYWKVLGTDLVKKEMIVSPSSLFTLKVDRAPKLFFPSKDAEILGLKQSNGEKKVLVFEWENLEVDTYQIEITSIGDKKRKTVVSKKVSTHKYVVGSLKTGEYGWRVKMATRDNKNSPWSEENIFYFSDSSLPPAPRNLKPEDMSQLAQNDLLGGIKFSWKGRSSAKYVLYVGRDPDFKKLVKKEVVKGLHYSWVTPKFGKFYWKLKPYAPQYEGNVPSSKTLRLDILLDRPTIIFPSHGTEYTLMDPDESLILEWQDPLGQKKNTGKQKFQLEIARDSSFSDVIEELELEKPNFEWKAPELGEYYWRIKSFYDFGESAYSERAKLMIKRPMAPHSPPIPPVIRMEIKKKKGDGDRNNGREISSIDGEDTYISMKFPEIKYVKEYIIEIYKDRDLDDSVKSDRLENRNFYWEDPEPGTYYLRYKVVDMWDQESEFSNTSRMILTYDVGLLRAPELYEPDPGDEVEAEKGDKVDFEWESLDWAKSYTIEISSDPGFGGTIYSKKVKDNEHSVNLFGLGISGNYYWRVAANQDGAKKNSKGVRFKVTRDDEKKKNLRDQLKSTGKPGEYQATIDEVKDGHVILTAEPSFISYSLELSEGVEGFSSIQSLTGAGVEGKYQSDSLWFGQLGYEMASGSLFGVVDFKYSDMTALFGTGFYLGGGVLLDFGLGIGIVSTTILSKSLIGPVITDEKFTGGIGQINMRYASTQHSAHRLALYGGFGGFTKMGLGYEFQYLFSKALYMAMGFESIGVTSTSESQTVTTTTKVSALLGLGGRF